MPGQIIVEAGKQISEIGSVTNSYYARRLSDQITASFYEACRIGNVVAAQQLMEGLQCEVARSACLVDVDKRQAADNIAAVHTRYQLEVLKAEEEGKITANS